MEAKVFDINLPTSWEELSDKQLEMVYHLFSRDLSAAEVKALCLCKWNGLKVLCQLPDKRFLVKREKEPEVALSPGQLQQASSTLDFLDEFPPRPVRIAQIGKFKAIAADFEKVPFEQYLFVENLFQGYLNTQQNELLKQIAQVLYDSDKVSPNKAQLIGVFYWMASLKGFFAKMFPNFYRPAQEEDNASLSGKVDLYRKLQEITNAQIRALTGGDITKEEKILKMDTWRALTELDAKAKEAEEYHRSVKKP